MKEIRTEEEYQEAIRSGVTVIKFFTNWCPDCHRIDPFMVEVEANFNTKFTMFEIDRDVLPELCQELNWSSQTINDKYCLASSPNSHK